MTRDQAKRIARAIFDDIEMSGLFSLDRVADVIERTARMERQQDEELDRKIAELCRRKPLHEASGPFGGTIIATTPELAKKASQLLDFSRVIRIEDINIDVFQNEVERVARNMHDANQTIIQPDD